jgi:hypothetical protein
MVFTTKPEVLSAAVGASDTPVDFGVIGRHGLPNKTDVHWLGQMIGPRGLCFLGDMDPVDLMIYCWLRESLPPGYVRYLGIGDRLMEMLELPTGTSAIPCAPSEQEALAVLREVFLDMANCVGPCCMQILNQGQKIELETALHGRRTLASVLQSAVP